MHFPVHFQVYSKYFFLQSPSLLDFMLPSMLERYYQVHLHVQSPVQPPHMLPCTPASMLSTQLLVLARDPDHPPAGRVWTSKWGHFSSRPVQNPDVLTLGRSNPDPDPSTRRFPQVSLDPSGPISSSGFRVSHLWLHSDMLLLFMRY